MYKRKTLIYKILLFAFAVLVFVFPSRDNPSIEEKALVTVLGLDKQDDKLVVSLEQTVATQKKEGGAELLTFDASGEDCPKALSVLTQKSGNEIELSHCGVMIIGEQLAIEGFSQHLDYLLSAGLISPQITLLTCEGKVTDFMSKLNEFSLINGSGLNDVVNYSDRSAFVKVTSALKFLSESNLPSATCSVPVVRFDGEAEGGISGSGESSDSKGPMLDTLSHAALFKNGKLVGKLSEKATKGVAILDKRSDSGYFDINDVSINDKTVTVPAGIKSKSSKLKASLDDEPVLIVEADFVLETKSKTSIYDNKRNVNEKEIKETLAKRAEQIMKEQIESALAESRKCGCDVLGIKNAFYKQCGKQYKFYGNKEDLLHKVQIKYKINTKIV